jgi:hypothetical protein
MADWRLNGLSMNNLVRVHKIAFLATASGNNLNLLELSNSMMNSRLVRLISSNGVCDAIYRGGQQ